jgi:hypothetical protein
MHYSWSTGLLRNEKGHLILLFTVFGEPAKPEEKREERYEGRKKD